MNQTRETFKEEAGIFKNKEYICLYTWETKERQVKGHFIDSYKNLPKTAKLLTSFYSLHLEKYLCSWNLYRTANRVYLLSSDYNKEFGLGRI